MLQVQRQVRSGWQDIGKEYTVARFARAAAIAYAAADRSRVYRLVKTSGAREVVAYFNEAGR